MQTSAQNSPAVLANRKLPPTKRRAPTIDRSEWPRKYLTWVATAEREAELLLQLRDRHTAHDVRNAIWSGYWLLIQERDKMVEGVRREGALLHIGAPGVLQ